uniref:Uncharacterized protein n=1 Tax=Oryza meridionalis TaxID=40149 RepID=A0A0E0DN21_9ORYZ
MTLLSRKLVQCLPIHHGYFGKIASTIASYPASLNPSRRSESEHSTTLAATTHQQAAAVRRRRGAEAGRRRVVHAAAAPAPGRPSPTRRRTVAISPSPRRPGQPLHAVTHASPPWLDSRQRHAPRAASQPRHGTSTPRRPDGATRSSIPSSWGAHHLFDGMATRCNGGRGARDFIGMFKDLKQTVANGLVAVRPPSVEEQTDAKFVMHKAKLEDFEQHLMTASQQENNMNEIIRFNKQKRHGLVEMLKGFV